MKHIKLKFLGLSVIAAALLLSGCVKETEVDPGKTDPGAEDDVTVYMKLSIPGAAATRGLSGAQEEVVTSADVFVFDKDLKLTDWKYGELQNNAGVISFSAILKASKNSTDKFRIMVLANTRLTTYSIFKGDNIGGHKGKTYAEVRALLQATIPPYADLSSKGIPMWGEIKDLVLLSGTNNSYSMDLLRSLARVDVGTHSAPVYAPSGQITGWRAIDNFSLEEAFIYKGNTHYALATDRANYDFDDKRVSTYSLPATTTKDAARRYADDVLSGTVTRDGVKGIGIGSTIYTGEADINMGSSAVYADNNHTNRMALVVAGYYNGSSTLSYYRLDFLEGTGVTLMDVLRNGNYQITIKSVSGPGSTTPDEAYTKFNTNMVVVVNRWSDAGQEGTTVNGEYWLQVNPYDFEFDKWERVDEEITIQTNVPVVSGKSWSAEVAKINAADADPAWLTLTSGTETGVTGGVLKFNATQIPDAFVGTERSARIVITAGTMKYSIIVTQKNEDTGILLRLSHSELVFIGRKWDTSSQTWIDPDPQTINVNWGPRKYGYDLSLTNYTNSGVDMASAFVSPGTNTTLMVSPAKIADNNSYLAANPFLERSSRLAFTVWNADRSSSMTKQVLIRQIYYSLILSGTKDYYYQGNTYTLNIKSNTAWTAAIDDGSTILENISATSGNGDTADGETLTFKIADGATIDARATITFSSPDDLFPPQTINIIAQDVLPNSYVVTPGGSQVIPVRKAYRVWEYDRDLYNDNGGTLPTGTVDVILLWQDTQNLIGTITLSGTGRNAQITVTTKNSTTQGNAIIAYRINGVVYWSWHIWVTSANPDLPANQGTAEGYTFMNRNLGAFGTSGYNAYGLMYQGGRKDPFPPAAATSGTARKTIYNGSNTALTNGTNGLFVASAPAYDGLTESIRKPTTILSGTYGNTHWYGLLEDNVRTDLWENGEYKSDFDPCPKNWRVAPIEFLNVMLDEVPLGTVNFTWNGMYWPSQGVVGHNAANFNIVNVGVTMGQWGVHPATFPYYLTVSTGGVGFGGRQCYSSPLRCVKDE